MIFESATPNWKDGKIRLNNLHIVCMPKSVQQEFLQGTPEKEPAVVQGDLLAGVQLDEDEVGEKRLKKMPWFDLTIDTLEVELSLMRLMEGKGLVKSANVKGIRGIIDNRRGNWNKNAVFDAEAIRKRHIPGDFEMESLTIDDLLLTVYMPTGFRPFPVSILQAQLSKLRKQWYAHIVDLMSIYNVLILSVIGCFMICFVRTQLLDRWIQVYLVYIRPKQKRVSWSTLIWKLKEVILT